MPDDTVFDSKQGDNGKPAAEAPKPAETPAGGVSKEEVATLVKESLDPVQKSISEMNQFFAKLQEQAAAGINAPQTPEGEQDWATKFYNEPQGTVQSEIAAQTAPVLEQAATTMGKMLLDNQKASVDREFGPGAWDEVFETRLAPLVADAAKSNPMSLMSSTAVDNAVKTIKGDNFDALVQRREKLAEGNTGPDKDLVEAAANRAVEMTGGMRRVQPDGVPKLDDEDSQEFLKGFFKNTGEQLDPSRLARLVGAGNTLEDWQKATKEDK